MTARSRSSVSDRCRPADRVGDVLQLGRVDVGPLGGVVDRHSPRRCADAGERPGHPASEQQPDEHDRCRRLRSRTRPARSWRGAARVGAVVPTRSSSSTTRPSSASSSTVHCVEPLGRTRRRPASADSGSSATDGHVRPPPLGRRREPGELCIERRLRCRPVRGKPFEHGALERDPSPVRLDELLVACGEVAADVGVLLGDRAGQLRHLQAGGTGLATIHEGILPGVHRRRRGSDRRAGRGRPPPHPGPSSRARRLSSGGCGRPSG